MMKPEKARIGKRIEDRLYHLRMKKSELAKQMNVEPATVSYYLNGKRQISANDLPRIAEIIKVPVNYFFDEEYDSTMPDYEPRRSVSVTIIPPARENKAPYTMGDTEQTPLTEETARELIEKLNAVIPMIRTQPKEQGV